MEKIKFPPFDTIREDWWTWKLKNGIIIKAKNVVISFQTRKADDQEISQLGYKMKTIVGLTEIDEKNKHKVPVPKGKLWKGINDKSLKLEEIVDYIIISNKNNYYEIYPEDSVTLLCSIRPYSVKIEKSNKFTIEGDPVYYLSTQQTIILSTINDGMIENTFSKAEETAETIAEEPMNHG